MSHFFNFFLDNSILSLKYKLFIFFLIILLLIATILEMLSVGMVIPLITALFDKDNIDRFNLFIPKFVLENNSNENNVIYYFLFLLIVIYALKNIFIFFQHYTQITFIKKVALLLQYKMLKNYSMKDILFFKNTNTAEILRDYQSELSIFTNILLQRFIVIVTELFIIVGLISFVFFIDRVISTYILIYFLSLSVGYYIFLQKKLFTLGSSRQHYTKETIKFLTEFVNLFLELKLLKKENFFLSRTSLAYTKVVESLTSKLFYTPILRLLIEFFFILLFCILVFVLLSNNKSLTDIITLLGFLAAAAFKLIPSINKLNTAIHEFRYYLPTAKKIMENIQDNKNEIKEIRKIEKLENFENLDIDELSFSFDDKKIFDNAKITLSINKIYGIIGKSGAGKTTLLNILMGFYPSKSKLYYNKKKYIQDFKSIQDQISYVPQNVYLYDDSIIKNVILNDIVTESDISKVKEIFNKLNLLDFVNNLESGLDTIVGEKGAKLSGGQVQRIGLARAIFHDRRIIILDEFTSALDNKTENELLEFLKTISENSTIIIVSHRLKPIEICHETYEIKNNKLIKFS